MATRGCTETPTRLENGSTAATAGFSCTPEECGNGRRRRGMCDRHYNRWHYRTRCALRPPARVDTIYDALAALTVPDGDCLVWRTGKEYPRMHYRGRRHKASHLAYVLHNGVDVPEGMGVLHTCDNPACVRGDHLVVGDQRENMAHAICRGRWGKHVKLSRAKAEYIRQHRHGARIQDLADQFDVKPRTVHDVLRGKTWVSECT